MDYFKDDQVASDIDTKYYESQERLSELLILSLKVADHLKVPRAQDFAKFGIGRRVSYLKDTINRFHDIARIEVKGDEIDESTRFEQTSLLSFFFFNLSGALDNLAWVYAFEYGVEHKSHFDISFEKPKFTKQLPMQLSSILARHSVWLSSHLGSFRDASAHRILPYIPPYIEIKGTGERVYSSYYAHDFDCSPTVPFHPQVICDVLGIIEILEVGLSSLVETQK